MKALILLIIILSVFIVGCDNNYPTMEEYMSFCISHNRTFIMKNKDSLIQSYQCYDEIDGVRNFYKINPDKKDMYLTEIGDN